MVTATRYPIRRWTARRAAKGDTGPVPDQQARTAAAIDIGSNSVHLLVAFATRSVRPGIHAQLVPLIDESDLIGLGDTLDARGAIPPEPIQQVIDSLDRQLTLAENAGASRRLVMGTEPLRRATNIDELQAAARRSIGHGVQVLSVRQEAELTFLGVTGGRRPREALAVIDIGGGSSEVSIHVPGHGLDVIGLPIGSARLTNAIVRHDPPTSDEIEALMSSAREVVASATWPEHARVRVRRAIFVGGTATNVARLGRLDRSQLNEDLHTVGRMPADEVVEHFDVRPRRARQMAAGVAIVSALLDRFLLGQADVSEASLRDGAIIAELASGDEWLSALPELIG